MYLCDVSIKDKVEEMAKNVYHLTDGIVGWKKLGNETSVYAPMK